MASTWKRVWREFFFHFEGFFFNHQTLSRSSLSLSSLSLLSLLSHFSTKEETRRKEKKTAHLAHQPEVRPVLRGLEGQVLEEVGRAWFFEFGFFR
jgi:hypothetical protein